ncbi:ABC transporter permease [Streptomyces sp. RG80]|uniref:ABC transporter permease n=1 Tax=Streptomyces sp. RG80 TaxID=3157340 RepID=UPI00338E72A5
MSVKANGVMAPGQALPSEGGLNVVRHAFVVARRNLKKIPGDPSLLLDATVMPMIFALMFIYVFGGAIAGTQADYRQFVMPGIMAITITIVARTTGIALAVDFSKGVVDRFRTLPIARSAVLSGQVIADVMRMILGQLVILAFALIIGFRVHTNMVSVLGAVALLTAFGVALSWISAFIGLTMRSVQSVETVTTLVMTPLQFGTSVFVMPGTMPGWLQVVVEWNPTTLVVDACRGMLLGGEVAEPTVKAMAWIAVLLAVFVPLSVRAYSRRRN